MCATFSENIRSFVPLSQNVNIVCKLCVMSHLWQFEGRDIHIVWVYLRLWKYVYVFINRWA